MKIVTNWDVYELNESIIGSGYPMRTYNQDYYRDLKESDFKRIEKLIKSSKNGNESHTQFLTGIIVNFDLTFSIKAWTEAERYKFLNFISSQSTMHKIIEFDLDNSYNEYVDKRIIEIMKELVLTYNDSQKEEDYLKILYSNPCGFKLTARMTTNYRCLRNIYKQRKNHRLPEWKEFCNWIEKLPYAELLLMQ